MEDAARGTRCRGKVTDDPTATVGRGERGRGGQEG